ncbi:MAG: sulfite exporter TauE/SafE family protein [Bacteroidales bacterium]|nr:sulfite exporter TauE/SafE family protein [Bacteroidales bacterium]
MNDVLILLVIGLLAGFISGGVGIGGGIVIVPALMFFLGYSQHQASGTTLAMMVAPIGLISAWNYYKSGYVEIKSSLIILSAFFLGSYFGSLLAVNLPAKTLQKIFGILLFAVSLKYIFGK